jgi:hypothetical protein
MATITLGGRELDVKPATLGFLKREILPWKRDTPKRVPGTELDIGGIADLEEEIINWRVRGLLLYLGHNTGVDATWIEDHVVDVEAAVTKVIAAAGQEPAPKATPGEAPRP